jgi:hypothetical protein
MAKKAHVQTQVCEGNSENEVDIVIGFDFGTSSSKIVIRDFGRQTAYAVPFGRLACNHNQYLIPTQIFISDKGKLSLYEGKYSFRKLKTRLLDSHDKPIFKSSKIGPQELAAAYMGLVIRLARAWFLKHTESIYRRTRIYWWLNLGIPSKNYDDEKTKGTLKTIGMAAWRLSTSEGEMTLKNAKQTLSEARGHIASKANNIDPEDIESLWLHPDFVTPHPEVIMEVVGYVRSPMKTNGLHLLIDVGAATLDCATFNIHSHEGEDVYPLFETRVEKYGTMVLHNRRMQELKNGLQKTLREIHSIDPLSPLPKETHYEIQPDKQILSNHDKAFFKECLGIIGNVIRTTREKRDPNSPAWKNGLPVFICGGGGRYRPYRKMVDKLGSNMTKWSQPFKEFIFKELPKPDQLEAPDLLHTEYDRLAVAYGLSFSPDEIGEIIPESRIEDIQTVQAAYDAEDRYVSKDMC